MAWVLHNSSSGWSERVTLVLVIVCMVYLLQGRVIVGCFLACICNLQSGCWGMIAMAAVAVMMIDPGLKMHLVLHIGVLQAKCSAANEQVVPIQIAV